ncbi:tetratricopeptide repeat protein [Arenibacter latericius]|uniref:tetratricopeptide repeat protein n=1 Tax=Arenibacter latericius TaxID=86104 RepID=UPI000414ACF5|nr:tetratricopeptide repeat protein [Arenibacter latericius]
MKWTSLFLILTWFTSFSQNPEFDSIYNNISRNLVSTRPVKALVETDYLFEISANQTEQAKALMLKASILRQNGLTSEAIKLIEQADGLFSSSENYIYIARFNGLLSTLFRENGITSSGKKALNKAIEASEKIKNKNDALRFQGNLQQELAYYAMEVGDHTNAIIYLKQGIELFNNLNKKYDPNFHLATTHELLGKNYLLLKKSDSAFINFDQALQHLHISQNPNSPLKGFIYNGLGATYQYQDEFENAHTYYLKALDVAEASNFYNLKVEVYKALRDYYKIISDNDNFILFTEKREKLINIARQSQIDIANKLIRRLQEKDKPIKWTNKHVLFFGISFLILIIIFGTYIYKRKRDLSHLQRLPDNNTSHNSASKTKRDEEKNYMSQETESNILQKLKEFENSNQFLDKNMSFSTLVGFLNSNSKYLRQILKRHKNTDYNHYINELRINYIVNRLKTNPDYLNYKISYLAEECGFSSHSKFSASFKNVTQLSPSEFIMNLRDKTVDIY